MDKPIDTLIFPDWIVPVVPRGEVLVDHALAVSQGRISAILPADEARSLQADETLELPGQVLLPGLVNMHGHAAMSLLRGYADDYPLMPWLEDHIWPVEGRHVGEEFVRDGTDLAIAEMLRSGTTCFSDMYFFPEIAAQSAQSAGMRCQLSIPIIGFPTAWASNADECISKGLTLRDELKQSDLIHMAFGPHAHYTLDEPALRKITTLANELDLPVQIHLHETAEEVAETVRATGQRSIAALQEIGMIGPRTQCVHMTELNEEEIALLATQGAHVIHCPDSNMKLGSGRCPVHLLAEAGINVALGTDGAASNNDLNMFGEMRSAALLAKVGDRDASRLPAAQVLEMATLGGARAMGLQGQIGSLETGKLADMIAVDLREPQTQPVHNPVSALVYSVDASQVSHSWINGKTVMRERQLLTLDLGDVMHRAAAWPARINEGAAQ